MHRTTCFSNIAVRTFTSNRTSLWSLGFWRTREQVTASTTKAIEPICVDFPDGVYEPLDPAKREVRLLRMVPPVNAAADDTFPCELQTFSLDEAPAYTALSYCWTKEPPTGAIHLNGKRFPVRPNLGTYLSFRWREDDASEWIFIDALCINQKDLVERSTQVLLMGDVYRNAKEVVSWLGRDSWLEHTLTKDKLLQWQAICDTPTDGHHRELTKEEGLLCYRFATAFTPPSYWLRMWIVQEVILARRLIVRCGSLVTHAERLLRCLNLLDPKGEQIEDEVAYGPWSPVMWQFDIEKSPARATAASTKMRNFLETREAILRAAGASKQQSMAKALRSYHSQQCTESRDAVFGSLGLTRSCLRPDYTVTVLDLFLFVLVEAYLEHAPGKSRMLQGAFESRDPLRVDELWFFVQGLTASLGLRPNDDVFALLFLQASELFLGRISAEWLYRGLLETYYNRDREKVGWARKRIARPRSKAHYWMMLGRLWVCRVRGSFLKYADDASEGKTFPEWVAKLQDQIKVCSSLLSERESDTSKAHNDRQHRV